MSHGRRGALATIALASVLAACGGSHPEAKDATSSYARNAPPPETGSDVGDQSSVPETTENKPSDEPAVKSGSSAAADPTFPEGASVDQATAAVPKGTARANLDADRLAEPLQQESVYEPCKVGSQHFKVRVAVWAGKPVGVDVMTPNKALAQCVDKQVRALTWPDKVHSLNTVEFSF